MTLSRRMRAAVSRRPAFRVSAGLDADDAQVSAQALDAPTTAQLVCSEHLSPGCAVVAGGRITASASQRRTKAQADVIALSLAGPPLPGANRPPSHPPQPLQAQENHQ